MIDFTTGVLKVANIFLSIVAGLLAATLFEVSNKRDLRPWRPLAVVLVLFAVQEILGALRSFGIYASAWLTHVNVSLILLFLIYALVLQINVVREHTA
jgi:hypothetical protein